MGTRSELQLCQTESSSHKMLHADHYQWINAVYAYVLC